MAAGFNDKVPEVLPSSANVLTPDSTLAPERITELFFIRVPVVSAHRANALVVELPGPRTLPAPAGVAHTKVPVPSLRRKVPEVPCEVGRTMV